MKLKVLTGLIASIFLVAGCDSSNSASSDPVADNPTHQPGDNPKTGKPDEGNPDKGNSDEGNPDEGTPAPVAQKAGWYLRTMAVAETANGTKYAHNTAGVFGELDDSSDAKDRHDISSYGKATFQVRFVNKKIDNEGEYYSDYRKYEGIPRKEVWTFLVKNERVDPALADLADASLKIEVADLRDVLKKEGDSRYIEKVSSDQGFKNNLTLVDVDNHQAYSYSELQNLTLGMDGKHVRTFRWVLNGDVDEEDYAPLAATQNVPVTTASASLKKRSLLHSKFGLPPE